MKIVTVNLPGIQIKALQVLQDLGMYTSRSEAVRAAVRGLFANKYKIDGKNAENAAVKINADRVIQGSITAGGIRELKEKIGERVDMQIATVAMTQTYIDAIARIVDEGKFANRSETVRAALQKSLCDDLTLAESMIDIIWKKKPDVRSIKRAPGKIDMRTIRTGWSNLGKRN